MFRVILNGVFNGAVNVIFGVVFYYEYTFVFKVLVKFFRIIVVGSF